MDANLVVSRGLQRSLAVDEGLDTKNFVLMYNGADPVRLEPSGTSIRSELGLSEDTLLFGMIGGFYRDPRKDQLTVCRSLPRVFAEIGNAHCIFAGGIESGAEDKAADCINFCIDQRVTDRVHFLGVRADVADILDAMDLFVFSSLHEGLPVAVCEAMLAGVPLIVSDIEPLREMTGNGRFASVFPVHDYEELARQLTRLLSEASARDELASSARKHAEENFSIGAHMTSLCSVYRNLLLDASKY
jgi:glycosyltransferase involved in cell wall biosynthesis